MVKRPFSLQGNVFQPGLILNLRVFLLAIYIVPFLLRNFYLHALSEIKFRDSFEC